MTDTYTLSPLLLRNTAWRTHIHTMRSAFKEGFMQQDTKRWLRAESLIKGKKGLSHLRTFFVLECLDALQNARPAEQRLAGAAFKLACQYAQKDQPSIKKRCYKTGLNTVLQFAEQVKTHPTPTGQPLPETAASLHRNTNLILDQMTELFGDDPMRQRGILTLSLLAARQTSSKMPSLASLHLQRAARMAAHNPSLKAEVLSASLTHYPDILLHATAADKARQPLTELICTLSGVDIVSDGFEAQGLIIPPQAKRRPLEAFVIGHVNGAPPCVEENGYIISLERPSRVGTLRETQGRKRSPLLQMADKLFENALSAPPALEALARKLESKAGLGVLAAHLRQNAAHKT